MKQYQLTVAGLIMLCCLNTVQLSFGESTQNHDNNNSGSSLSGAGSRPASDNQKISENFDRLIQTLAGFNQGATIVYNLKKFSSSEVSSITLDNQKIVELKKSIEAVKNYAEKLKKCGESATEDRVSFELLKTLNDFITFIVEQKAVGNFTPKGTLIDKEINTFVIRVQRALEEKATKFKNDVNFFEKADKELNTQLVVIAKLLQGGSWDRTVFDEEKVKEDLTRKAIRDANKDTKMCRLEGGAQESVPNQPAPPTLSPAVPAVPAVPVVPAVPAVPPLDPSGGGFVSTQLRDALDALRRAEDDRLRERQQQDKLVRRLLDQENRNGDQALKALQGALASSQRPNVSRGNSEGPQISPSLSIPPSQQQPLPQMPPFQMPPPPPPLPLGALMNSGPSQPIIPYTPSRFNDDIPRPAAPVQPDPSTSALLQSMQQQNQMFQQMMMGRYPYMGNGVQNVNGAGNVGQALQNFGGGLRYSTGGATGRGPRLLPSRFRGNARGGIQGRMSTNPVARTAIPSRIGRR